MANDKNRPEYEVFNVPLGAGLNQAVDDYLIDPPKSLIIRNGRFEKQGRIEKRTGYELVPVTGLAAGGARQVFTADGSLAAITEIGTQTRSTLTSPWSMPKAADTFESASLPFPTHLTMGAVARSVTGVDHVSCAIIGNVEVYCWTEVDQAGTTTTVLAVVRDRVTGAVYHGPEELFTGTTPGVIAVRAAGEAALTTFVIMARVTGVGIDARTLVAATPWNGWSGVTTLTNTDDNIFDATASEDGFFFHVITGPVGVETTVVRYNSALVQQEVFDIAQVSDRARAVYSHDGRLFLGIASAINNPPRVGRFADEEDYAVGGFSGFVDVVAGSITAAHQVEHITFNKFSTTLARIRFVWDESRSGANTFSTDRHALRWRPVDMTGAPTAVAASRIDNLWLTAKAFDIAQPSGSRLGCMNIGYAPRAPAANISVLPNIKPINTTQPCNFVAVPYDDVYDVASGAPTRGPNQLLVLARVASLRAESPYTGLLPTHRFHRLGDVGAAGGNIWRIPVLVRAVQTTIDSFTQTNYFLGLDYAEFTALPTRIQTAREKLDETYASGGILSFFDGVRGFESSPHFAPEVPILSSAATPGTNLTSGIYRYRQTWELHEDKGIIHRSSPSGSARITIVAAVPDQHTVTLTTIDTACRLSEMNDTNRRRLRLCIWRTQDEGNADFTGLYYLVGRFEPNLGTIGLATATDEMDDATLAKQEILYTEGGYLEAVPPPAPTDLAIGKTRMFIVDGEDQNRIWVSKLFEYGLGPEFNAALTIRADQGAGPITAIELLDDTLVVFKEASIYGFRGEGPNNAGALGSFGEAFRISSSIGCLGKPSVVVTEAGLLFQSRTGIYLLTRGLETKYIGAPVEDWLGSLTVGSSIVLPDTSEVVFTLVNDAQALVWNYLFNEWTVWNNHTMRNGVLWNNLFTWIRADGRGRRATTAYADLHATTDAAIQIVLELRTPWLKPAGLQGFVNIPRISLLGRRTSTEGGITVSIGYDYLEAFPVGSVRTWTSGELDVLQAARDRLQLELDPPASQVEAIRFNFVDLVGSPNQFVRGPMYINLALNVKGYGGTFRDIVGTRR